MADFRAYCPPGTPAGGVITLSPEESHHLVAVNRARAGQEVIAFDGEGNDWTCTLAEAHKTHAVLSVRETRRAPPLRCEITLAQALPKGGGMDAIVRKATEIGASCIIPLESERTQVHLAGERSEKKGTKWQVAALEAAKQCGNPWLPRIAPVQQATALITAAADYDLKLISCLLPGANSFKRVLGDYLNTHNTPPRRVLWLIGPEGDFSPAEVELALNNGFTPVTLGPLVLRCETAAVYALSVLSYELLA